MAKCVVCNKNTSKSYYSLCLDCWKKQKEREKDLHIKNSNVINNSTIENRNKPVKERKIIAGGFWKWAFSPMNIRYNYRGQTMRTPTPNILAPIVLPLMIISILPILVVIAPFWIFIKIKETFKK